MTTLIKISQLPSATTPLAGSEVMTVVQGGVTKKISASAINDMITSPVTTAQAAAEAAAAAAADSADSASTSAALAAAQVAQADSYATNSENSATASAASASLAQDWATKTTGEVVTGQGYSAKKYAQDSANSAASIGSSVTAAAASATAAATSEANALTSKNAAATSASTASTKATEASASATSAATSASTATTKASDAAGSATSASASASSATASATTATTKAGEAATSATNAATSATNAATSETNALSYKNSANTSATTATTQAGIATTKAGEAATSATNAAASASAASTSESNALSYKNTAATSASTATTQAGIATTQAGIATSKASEAEASKTAADTDAAATAADRFQTGLDASTATAKAAIATTKASEAASSASAAASSASAAAASQSSALSSKDSAEAAAATASTKADEATVQAGIATTQATTATTQAGIATTKAGEAASSATAASSAQAAAESARDSTLAAFDSFDDRYLGPKASDPTVDNDGNALVAGALYYCTATGIEGMKVYTGSAWVAAYVSGGGTLSAANNLSDLTSISTAKTNLGLATVASTGSYTDLTDKPTLFSGAYSDLTGKPTLFSGAYADLTGKPTIPTVPTNVSAFTNDAGYLTSYTETDPVFAAHPAYGVTGTKITNWDTAYSWGNHASAGYLTTSSASATYQPKDADLTAIAGLAGASGLLKKTAADTWSLDTNTYITGNQSISVSGDATGSGTTSIALTLANSGVTAGTYNNSATAVTPITFDAKGRATGTGTAVTITPAWSSITSKPTTLSGYGITDAQPSSTAITTSNIGSQSVNYAASAGSAASSPLLSTLANYAWSASTTPASFNQGVQTSFVSNGQGFQNYGSVMTMNTYSSGGGALQLYVPYSPTYGGTGLQVRFGNYDVSGGNSWTSWKTLLASDNYNSYSPTLTGTGASGSWGISITGSSASCTGNAATVTINYNNDSNSTYQMLWGSGNGVYGTGGIYCNPATDYLYASSFYCGNWFRSSGATGWYNESYSVGIYATETGNVRTYNGANFISAGNVTAYSDERLKKNWRDMPADFVDHLANVKSGVFDRTDNEFAKTQVGVSAQSLRNVMPHAVLEDSDGMLSVAYGNAALAACVELAKRVVSLEAEIKSLKG